MDNKQLTTEERNEIIRNPAVRRKLAFENIQYFFAIYLSQHITYALATFHYDFFDIAEDETNLFAIVLAFRGSGKSTIFSLCYPGNHWKTAQTICHHYYSNATAGKKDNGQYKKRDGNQRNFKS
jgi:hypothetical protein